MGAVSALSAISPDAMLTICAVVCILVIGVVVLSEHARETSRTLEYLSRKGLTYAEAMSILGIPENHPAGMLTGVWGTNPNAERWWWRCSLCREFDHSLPPEAAASAASSHVCVPAALEAAKAEAKRMHPAFQDTPEAGRFPDPGRRELS